MNAEQLETIKQDRDRIVAEVRKINAHIQSNWNNMDVIERSLCFSQRKHMSDCIECISARIEYATNKMKQ